MRTTETLGPLFAERAPTLGRGKFTLQGSYTFFRYHTFGGRDLDNLQVVARHDTDSVGFPDTREQFEHDVVLITFDIDIRVWVLALTATYGITDRLDIGVLVPLANIRMDVKSTARVVESDQNTLFPGVHSFDDTVESARDAARGSATGLGDIVLRAKYHLIKSPLLDMATALLLTLPTGEEDNFLGTGDVTVRPFLIFSRTFFEVLTPHINIGYEFNTGHSHHSALEYVLGIDAGIKRFTVAGALLGSYEPDGDGIGDHILNASLGIKWNPVGQLLLAANVQLPLNDNGLRSDLITTFSLEYSF